MPSSENTSVFVFSEESHIMCRKLLEVKYERLFNMLRLLNVLTVWGEKVPLYVFYNLQCSAKIEAKN